MARRRVKFTNERMFLTIERRVQAAEDILEPDTKIKGNEYEVEENCVTGRQTEKPKQFEEIHWADQPARQE
ncbi:MAG: hypothetical protein M3O09_11750 [Acidobacteriota bacterium]|nr:hypothetical protein [Acidobacteriota bacterium]